MTNSPQLPDQEIIFSNTCADISLPKGERFAYIRWKDVSSEKAFHEANLALAEVIERSGRKALLSDISQSENPSPKLVKDTIEIYIPMLFTAGLSVTALVRSELVTVQAAADAVEEKGNTYIFNRQFDNIPEAAEWLRLYLDWE